MSRHPGRVIVGGALVLALLWPPGTIAAQSTPSMDGDHRMSILVHITHGPEHPTRAALGFAVAAAALEQGHEVSVFLAGDGVQLARSGVIEELAGLGTGRLSDAVATLTNGGARFFLSGGSSAARGLAADQIGLPGVEMAAPARLVELSLEHDRLFVY